MTSKISAGERLEDREDTELEQDRELEQIDRLILRCQSRMSNVSDGILSSATRKATLDMYEDLRKEAADNVSLRAQRLEWMEENVVRLQETIVKAAHEREMFEHDLEQAVEKKWINKKDVAKWMAEFDDPDQLEMHRSEWQKGEWKTKYIAGWRKLDEDREKVIKRAKEAGLTAKDLPSIGILENTEEFLAEERKFPMRRSLVDMVDADITAELTGQRALFRQMESMLKGASEAQDRCLHPAKVGAWLQKIMNDPKRYTPQVMEKYKAEWLQSRARYDVLAGRYATEGQPDGCAPMSVNAFLETPFTAQAVKLTEWENRLNAALRLSEASDDAFELEIQAIRRSVDLKDVDSAERRLAMLRRDHANDPDVLSIAADIAMTRATKEEQEETKDESQRTANAQQELHAILTGVPPTLARMYGALARGTAEQAATVFWPMKMRVERKDAGRTNAHDEFVAELKADAADEAEVAPETTDIGTEDEAELRINEGTSASDTLQLIAQHAARGSVRSLSLVPAGVSVEQQRQLVRMNERMLAHMRHLESVGQRYEHPALALAA